MDTPDKNVENAEQSLNPQFIFPSGIVYECIKCGNCCSDYWEIPIDNESVDALKNEDLFKTSFSSRTLEPFHKSSIEPDRWCLRRKDTNCVFSTLQKHCSIHTYLGFEKKPQLCRDYPFKYIKTPGGVYIALSFSCQSVLRELGSPIESCEQFLNSNYNNSKAIFEIQKPIKLSPRVEIPWEIYLKIEEALIDFLDLEVYSLDDRLIGGDVFLNLLEEFIVEASTDPKNTLPLIVDTFIDNIQKQNYARIIKIAQKPNSSNLVQRMFISMLTAFRNTITIKRGIISTLYLVLSKYLKSALKIDRIKLYPLLNTFLFSDFYSVRFVREESFFNYHLLRYLKHLIKTKHLILNTPMISGYNSLLLLTAIIKWYCTGQISGRENPDVVRGDINNAIMWTEKYYGFNSLFPLLLDRYPILSDSLNRLFERKNYASSIIRSLRR